MNTVWVVQYTDGVPGHIAAVFDNEKAAVEMCENHNEAFLKGYGNQMLMFEAWGVRTAVEFSKR